jgi:hypothetical protein
MMPLRSATVPRTPGPGSTPGVPHHGNEIDRGDRVLVRRVRAGSGGRARVPGRAAAAHAAVAVRRGGFFVQAAGGDRGPCREAEVRTMSAGELIAQVCIERDEARRAAEVQAAEVARSNELVAALRIDKAEAIGQLHEVTARAFVMAAVARWSWLAHWFV